MATPRAGATKRRTRAQEEKEQLILESALDVFSRHGFRGSTIDQIAEVAGMSKPNLLYYFANKEAIHRLLIDRQLDTWLQPLREIDVDGDPLGEIGGYIRRKLEMARDYPAVTAAAPWFAPAAREATFLMGLDAFLDGWLGARGQPGV